MPKVNIQSTSKLSTQETFEKVKNLLNDDKDLKKLDPNYKCEFNESNFTGTAKSNLFKANMKIDGPDGNVNVEIIVDLPFHLALAKGVVKKTLEKKLTHALG